MRISNLRGYFRVDDRVVIVVIKVGKSRNDAIGQSSSHSVCGQRSHVLCCPFAVVAVFVVTGLHVYSQSLTFGCRTGLQTDMMCTRA